MSGVFLILLSILFFETGSLVGLEPSASALLVLALQMCANMACFLFSVALGTLLLNHILSHPCIL